MTGISFINPVVLVAGIGDYSAMNTGDDVVMTDFVFGAPGNLTTTPPVSFTLWSQANTGWYFQLDSLMINEITTAGDRELGGFGTVYAPGFKPTSAKWDLRSTGTTKTFFYVSDTTSVPDGGTSMALLGLSLVSLPLLRKTLMR